MGSEMCIRDRKSPSGSGEVTGCLAIRMLAKRDAVGEHEQRRTAMKSG